MQLHFYVVTFVLLAVYRPLKDIWYEHEPVLGKGENSEETV